MTPMEAAVRVARINHDVALWLEFVERAQNGQLAEAAALDHMTSEVFRKVGMLG